MSIFRFLNPFHVIKVLKAVKNATEGYGKVIADIEDLNIRLKNVDARLSDMDGRISGMDAGLSDMGDRLSVADAGLSDMGDRLSVVDAGLSDMGDRLSVADAGLSDMGDRLSVADVRLSGMDARLSDMDGRLSSMDDRLSGTDARLSNMDDRISVADTGLSNMDGKCKDIDNKLKDLSTICEFQKTKIHMLEKREKNQIVENNGLEVEQNVQELNKPKSQQIYSNIDYFDFENHFRGSMAHIREAQKIYLKYFEGHDNVIDLGCGRGEFLELLKENGIDAHGVDSYEEFVEMCRLRNLKVTCEDALEFLRAQEKVGGIFAAQLIEHLTIDQVVTLCELAYEKLEEGAYVILETPNPMSLSIFTKSFYIDPSHDKPVHPFTAKYILQRAGFKKVEIIYTETSKTPITIPAIEMDNMDEFNHVMKQIEKMLFGSQDYAVIARR